MANTLQSGKTDLNNNQIRLNKYIAQAGIASRRKADELIEQGKVKINGRVVKDHGVRINPRQDSVKVNNRQIKKQQESVTLMFNKPIKVITSMKDPEGRICVGDYFTKAPVRLFPVGRLDWDSEGLLLMTSDGELAQQIMHPKFEIPKTYIVKVRGQITEEQIAKLMKGVSIIGGKVKALRAKRIPSRGNDNNHWVSITISEGKNRQIRRMFEKIGSDVMKLQRVAIGQLRLGNTKRGEAKILSDRDIKKIFQLREDEE